MSLPTVDEGLGFITYDTVATNSALLSKQQSDLSGSRRRESQEYHPCFFVFDSRFKNTLQPHQCITIQNKIRICGMRQVQGTTVAVLCGVGIKGIAPQKNVKGGSTTFLLSQLFGSQECIGGNPFFKATEYSKYIFKTSCNGNGFLWRGELFQLYGRNTFQVSFQSQSQYAHLFFPPFIW